MVNSDLTPSASHDPKDLVGTWKLVSVVTEQDGRKFDAYGPNAKACWCLILTGDIQLHGVKRTRCAQNELFRV